MNHDIAITLTAWPVGAVIYLIACQRAHVRRQTLRRQTLRRQDARRQADAHQARR